MNKLMTLYIDGQYIKVSPTIADTLTPGVFKAKGVFETMLAINGRVENIKVHLQRLHKGLKILNMPAVNVPEPVIRRVARLHAHPLARDRKSTRLNSSH